MFNIRGCDKADLKRLAELNSSDLAKRPVVHEYDYSDDPYRIYLHTQQDGFAHGKALGLDRLRQFQGHDRCDPAPEVEEGAELIPAYGLHPCGAIRVDAASRWSSGVLIPPWG